jgi:hypothetical protein
MFKFLTIIWLAIALSSLVQAAPADIILEEMWTVWSQKVPSWDLNTMVIARHIVLREKRIGGLMNVYCFLVPTTSSRTTRRLLHPIRISPIASSCAARFQVSEQARKRYAKILTVICESPRLFGIRMERTVIWRQPMFAFLSRMDEIRDRCHPGRKKVRL